MVSQPDELTRKLRKTLFIFLTSLVSKMVNFDDDVYIVPKGYLFCTYMYVFRFMAFVICIIIHI